MLQLLGDVVSQTPYLGSALEPCWETYVSPRPPTDLSLGYVYLPPESCDARIISGLWCCYLHSFVI